ncbi:DUF2017 domain-containing protein [Yinghuangia seranimata]|uniref:DUF2017 domain-containing protein n=1 Tax=Yinghuangia seranimata TaxID=408067 RepID=UPI00248C6CE0|nr:DUF2017 domain-containing protein [Yinghuangia seranimata]MDI2131382.1 DUF2017 domain-containing protein [Yinghuangia seranimata]
MNGHFVRGRKSGRPEIVLDELHGELLADLCRQVIDLVAPEPAADAASDDPLARELGLDGLDWGGLDAPDTPPPATPDDPVLARLLPDAYQDDPGAAAEFRRFTENDLRQRKCANARTVRTDIAAAGAEGHIVLDEQHSQAWLGAINDLRLALGTNLGVTEDLDEYARGLHEDDPRLAVLAVYHWLGMLQETLVESLTP